MATKRQSKIQWYGDTLGTDGKAQPPVIAPDVERHLEGLNRGEIYICDNEEDPVLFIRTNKDTVVGIRGSASVVELAKYFLRKDQPDATQYLLRLLGGAEFGVFTQGLLGTGGAVTIDEDGNSHAEFDYLTIRKIVTFIELVIQQAKSVGGMIIVSPSNIKISNVEETETSYRCYFENKDSENEIVNLFEVGDQARRQTFNLADGQVYYWRLVTSVGSNYIDLSKTDCDTGSTVPQPGDEIVTLGNRNNKIRQSAIIISAYGDGSPSIRYYQNIDSYSLVEKVMKEDYYDYSTGRFKTVTYGDSYVGDRNGDTFVKYDQDNGVEIKGKISIQQGSSGVGNFNDLPDEIANSVKVGGENLLLNSGFIGDYAPRELYQDTDLKGNMQMYSPSMAKWTGIGKAIEDKESRSGYCCQIGNISQPVSLIQEESYVVTYKAKGESITILFGETNITQELTNVYQRYEHKFMYSGDGIFLMSGTASVCEIKLERGTIATDWCPSHLDPPAIADKFKELWYIQDALKGNTQILGGLTLTSMIQLGKWTDGILERVNAGVSGIYNDDLDVAFWAGGTYPQAIATVRKIMSGDNPTDEEWKFLAKFVATHGGDLFLRGYIYALGGVFRGTVYAKDGVFSGSIHSNNGNIGDWIIQNSLQSSDFKMPEFQSPDPENDIEGGVVSGGEGSKLSKSGIVIGCSGNTTGVLPPSSGARLAGIINAEGENAWVQALYISAKNTDAYGSLSDTIALELNASCTYENPMHKPKALKISSGFADIPGVILAGRISANGDIIYGYGKNNPAFTCSRNGGNNDYEYTITHRIGHNRYTVEATPYISASTWRKVHAIITYMDRSIFRIRLVDSGTENDGEACDFMFNVIGDNY